MTDSSEARAIRQSLMDWTRRRRGLLASLVAVVLAAAVVVALFPDSFAPDLGYIDEWIYVGLGHDYWTTVLENYKHSRLTWLLPLALTTRFLPPVSGFLALQAGCLALGAGSAVLLLRRVVSPALAAAAGVVAVLTWSFVAVGGAAYHNTIALPLVATVCLAIVWAIDRRTLSGWIVAGAIAGLMVHANLLTLFMVPYLVAVYALWAWTRNQLGRRGVAQAVLGLLLGAVGLTIVFGLISVVTGQAFFFWWTGLRTAVASSTGQGAWYLPLFGSWLGEARYLFMPAIAALGSGVLLLGGWVRGGLPRSRAVVFPVAFLILAAVWVLLQAIGVLALQPDYFAIQLQYPSLIAVVSLLGCRDLRPIARPAYHTAKGSSDSPWLILTTGLVISAALILLFLWSPEFVPLGWVESGGFWVTVALAGLAVGLAAWLPAGRAGLAAFAAGALVLFALVLATQGQNRTATYLLSCRGTKVAALPVVDALHEVIADRVAFAAAHGRETAVVVSGSTISASSADAERIRETGPFDYLDETVGATCVQGLGSALPSAVAQGLYSQWPAWFVPVRKGTSGLAAVGTQWDISREGRGAWSVVLMAPTRTELDRLIREFSESAPDDSSFDVHHYVASPYQVWLATESRAK